MRTIKPGQLSSTPLGQAVIKNSNSQKALRVAKTQARDRIMQIVREKLHPSRSLRTLSSKLDQILEFKIEINPKNKGKFNATKKKTGETTEELEHSKNPKTRKRAVFAENAKHWNHKMSSGEGTYKLRNKRTPAVAQPDSFEISTLLDNILQFKAIDLGRTYGNPTAAPEGGMSSIPEKHYPSLYIDDRDKELNLPLEGHAKVKFKLKRKTSTQDHEGKTRHSADIEIHSIEHLKEDENPVEGGRAKLLPLSAKLDTLLEFDDRPRNTQGEFTPQGENGPDPNAMAKVYTHAKHVGLAEGAGVAAGSAAVGPLAKALFEKIHKAKV